MISGYIPLALLLINARTAHLFWLDKRYAQEGRRRIPESSLLMMAAVGGTPGALAARQWFRHKTRKQPFSTWLWLIALVQIGLIAWFIF
ncbi:uncharacterized membrane protein YsdA (DUF1294 family) [Novosphingobium sp. SG751A]|uniref:DUF1294 domain-containing protein n=1 Tax=Novosphingobium sp. SG751A TaxID=2587000 RepID=UPI001C129CBD|nr:DUF1294 domain-containing protein [Novosphingobium sp. SG751A]NOW47006.1 uncharacterized membrane protein YsdA (DUF1294 family) [Novosphingobium sp. SG751A]